MNSDKNSVSMAVDLSRLPKDPIAEDQLADILSIGREVDLLETIRSSDKTAKISMQLIRLHASYMDIPRKLFDVQFNLQFQGKKMIMVNGDAVELLYHTGSEVYNYGIKRINEITDEAQSNLLNILSAGLTKTVPASSFYDALAMFPKPFRDGLWNFIVTENKVLIPFSWRNESFLISHRLYKDEKKFKMAMEILEDQKLANIVEFLQNNPGNPLPVVSQFLGTDVVTLNLLSKYGLLEPIKLEVKGDNKDYLFSPGSTLSREDKDHFDLVKMTLANFRFGEYYSKKTKLYSLNRFLGYMLDHGYAGAAEAIGTDYENLEKKGIVKVQKISDSNYRFWLLKRDVIEDARDIVKGAIPIRSARNVGNLTNIDNLIQTRKQINVEVSQASQAEIIKALREIQEGLCS